MTGRRLPDDVYNARWMARVVSRCVRNEHGCLIWQGAKTWNGYATDQYRCKTKALHRVVYQIAHNVQLPRSIDVCHTCDVRPCLEITHLWTGTRQQNVDDMTAKRRHANTIKDACKSGHPFTPENTYFHEGTGKRHCRVCQRIRLRIKAGWSREEAEREPPIPIGTQTKRRYIGVRRELLSRQSSERTP